MKISPKDWTFREIGRFLCNFKKLSLPKKPFLKKIAFPNKSFIINSFLSNKPFCGHIICKNRFLPKKHSTLTFRTFLDYLEKNNFLTTFPKLSTFWKRMFLWDHFNKIDFRPKKFSRRSLLNYQKCEKKAFLKKSLEKIVIGPYFPNYLHSMKITIYSDYFEK